MHVNGIELNKVSHVLRAKMESAKTLLILRNYTFYRISSNKFKIHINTVTFVAIVGFLKEEKGEQPGIICSLKNTDFYFYF